MSDFGHLMNRNKVQLMIIVP